jgi:hypothetical protein
MGREHGVEGTVDGVTSKVQPSFYLVGAPGTRKSKIAEELAEHYFDNKLALFDENLSGMSWALGSVADYRVELKLALNRALQTPSDKPTLYAHSLIDNLAYISFALSRYNLSGAVSLGTVERAMMTFAIIGTLVTDSFKYDHIFFLTGDFDPNEDYDQYQIQSCLQLVLDQYGISYSIIESNEEAIDKIAETLKGYLNGDGRTNSSTIE